MKAIPLSVIVIMGLTTPALAASPAGAVQETPRPPTIQISQNSQISQNTQNNLPNDGEVSEVLAGGGYTYLQVMKDGKGTWLAIPGRKIPVGAKIRYRRGMSMKSFHSKTLNRTFDKIFFMGGIQVVGETSAPGVSGHPPTPDRKPRQEDRPNSGQVSEVLAAGGYTYLHVMNDGKGIWLAIPGRRIPVGAKVRYGQGAAMKAFHSKTLNRTFDVVYFLGSVAVEGE